MNVNNPVNSLERKVRSRRGAVTLRTLGAAACLFLTAWSARAEAAWLDGAWSSRRKVTIAAALAPETLANFPVLVHFAEQTNALFRMCQTNGQDIVFTAADGVTRLAHEIDSYSARGTKLLNAWVRVPELSPSSDTVLYMYYGNPTAADQQDRAVLWADYAGVWHLNEDLPGANTTTEVYRDSTTNACHGRDCVSTNCVAGRVGNGANLDGDDYVQLIRTLYTTNDFTITAWARPSQIDWEAVMGDTGSRYFALITASRIYGRSSISNNGHQVVSGDNAKLTINAWHHVAFRSTGEAGATRQLYQNGTNVTAGTNHALLPPLNTDPWNMIGKWGNATSYKFFHGVLDEVRLSDKALPAAWIDAECRNASSPSAYVSFGPEEGASAAPWPSARFAYRQEILVWPGVTVAALTNFPMLVAVTNQDNHLFSVAAADGRDILFTDSDGVTRLPHEAERYAASPAAFYAWVRVPVLHAAAPTRMYLYYGRNSEFARLDKTNVWSEGYLGVWHLNEAVGNGQTNHDSSASAAHGVFKDPNGRGGGDAVGKIAGADAFAGFDDHYVLTPGVQCPTNGFTVSAWVSVVSTNLEGMFECGDPGSAYFQVKKAKAMVAAYCENPPYYYRYAFGDAAIREGAWHHLTAVCAPPKIAVYRDGNFEGESVMFTNLYKQSRANYIGRYVVANSAFNGRVDELRVSGVTRTPEWIKACYLSQNEPGAALTFEPPEANASFGTLIAIR